MFYNVLKESIMTEAEFISQYEGTKNLARTRGFKIRNHGKSLQLYPLDSNGSLVPSPYFKTIEAVSAYLAGLRDRDRQPWREPEDGEEHS